MYDYEKNLIKEDENFLIELGENIKKARQDNLKDMRKNIQENSGIKCLNVNMSQKQISKKIGFGEKYLGEIENGKRKIGIVELINICNQINSTPNEVLKKWIKPKK